MPPPLLLLLPMMLLSAMQVAAATKQWDGTGSFVFTSSMSVCATDDGGEVNENCPLVPQGKSPSTDRYAQLQIGVLGKPGGGGGGGASRMVVTSMRTAHWCSRARALAPTGLHGVQIVRRGVGLDRCVLQTTVVKRK